MMKRGNVILFVGILIFFLVTPFVTSLAVSPSKTLVFFTGDDINEQLSVNVRNRYDFPIIGELYVRSNEVPLEYVNFETVNVTFAPGETKTFTFDLNVPTQFSEPGDHQLEFIVRELLPTNRTELITVRTAVGSIFIIRVPFEGYFLKATMDVKSVSSGEKVPISLVLENLGTYPIENIDGIVEIYNSDEEKVGEVPFTYFLKVQSYETLELEWDSAGMEYGNYHAKAILRFNGKIVETEDDFKLGDVHITILDFDKSIVSGDINKYNLQIRSDWGNTIEGVLASLEVESDFPQIFRSETFNLGPWEEKKVVIYVDAEDISGGEYPAILKLDYEGITSQEKFDLKVSSFNFMMLVIGGIIFIVVFAVGYIFLMKRKPKKIKNGAKN